LPNFGDAQTSSNGLKVTLKADQRRDGDLIHNKCKDCELTQPNFRLLAEMRKLWCAGCAKGHAGATNFQPLEMRKQKRTESTKIFEHQPS
jgi:hypothetical protein